MADVGNRELSPVEELVAVEVGHGYLCGRNKEGILSCHRMTHLKEVIFKLGELSCAFKS
jgi:hypothetical protein